MLYEYYRAAKQGAAVVEEDWFGVLKLEGAERTTWLQGMVTNDVEKLQPGEGCYAAHLNSQGKMVAQMAVLAAEDALWLTLERGAVGKLASAFDKLIIMEDVQVQDLSSSFEVIGVLGPDSGRVLEEWIGEPLRLDAAYAHRAHGACRILRGELGYEVLVPGGIADKVLHDIAARGATPIDHGTWDVLRTEAGIPMYGIDLDDTTVFPELGGKGISYDKGCYIGQEVVAKVKYIGHVNRRFVGFVCEGDRPPEVRSKVEAGGKEVGYITTSLLSPGLGKPVGLGFAARASAEPGTAVELVRGETRVPAVVARLPLVAEPLI